MKSYNKSILNHSEKEFLASQVERYPILYDKDLKIYKNNNGKENVWGEIKKRFDEVHNKSYCEYSSLVI